MFVIFALVAGLFGFGGVAGPTAWLGEILSVLFGGLALVCALDRLGSLRGFDAPADPPEP